MKKKLIEHCPLVYAEVKKIKRGQVKTYGQIATKTGLTPRQVGWCLHRNPDQQSIPCHRVVNAKGQVAKNFAFGGAAGQLRLLAQEKYAAKKV